MTKNSSTRSTRLSREPIKTTASLRRPPRPPGPAVGPDVEPVVLPVVIIILFLLQCNVRLTRVRAAPRRAYRTVLRVARGGAAGCSIIASLFHCWCLSEARAGGQLPVKGSTVGRPRVRLLTHGGGQLAHGGQGDEDAGASPGGQKQLWPDACAPPRATFSRLWRRPLFDVLLCTNAHAL